MATAYPITPGVTFKDIEGFPRYCVGDDGSVWSGRGNPNGRKRDRLRAGWRLLKAVINRRRGGYAQVTLCSKEKPYARKKVHQLVLEVFVGPCPPGMEACHYPDPDPSNNRLDNLRWDTHEANLADAVRLGRMRIGVKSASASFDETQLAEVRSLCEAGMSYVAVARRYGVSDDTVWRAFTKKTYRE